MIIAMGCDHGGFKLKEQIKEYLLSLGHEVLDFGTNSLDSCHYPVYAFKAANSVKSGESERGILVCTTGEGIMIAANKVEGIRCGLAYNKEAAALMVQHNNANMMALGAKFTTFEEAKERVDTFLTSSFLGERHALRVKMITDYEKEHKC